MRRILLASTFALVSTMALANSPAPVTPTTGPTYNHPVANGGAGGLGAGGAGGLAASSAAASSSAAARSGSAAGASAVGNGSGSNNNLTLVPPSIALPSIGGGGSDCPVVGFGVGGSGLTGAGGFGPSWISSDCNTRKLAELLSSLGYRDAALAVLEDHYPEVKRAMAQPIQPACGTTASSWTR